VARHNGADVPFLRPSAAATDTSKAAEYVEHALEALESTDGSYDWVVILQPTCPSRNAEEIHRALDLFAVSAAQSMISCYPEEYINVGVMYEPAESNRIRPKIPNHNEGRRRQDHAPVFVRNGAVYGTRVPYFKATGRLICDQPMLMKMKKIDSVNLDTLEDLELLRALMCK